MWKMWKNGENQTWQILTALYIIHNVPGAYFYTKCSEPGLKKNKKLHGEPFRSPSKLNYRLCAPRQVFVRELILIDIAQNTRTFSAKLNILKKLKLSVASPWRIICVSSWHSLKRRLSDLMNLKAFLGPHAALSVLQNEIYSFECQIIRMHSFCPCLPRVSMGGPLWILFY